MPSEADRAPEETTSQPLPDAQDNAEQSKETQAQATEVVATEEAPDEAQGKRTFGGLTPQEAGRRGGLRRQEQARSRETEAVALSSGKVIVVRTPVEVGHIIARLAVDAKKGNTQAARELREWMRQFPAEDETDISALDARTQQQVLARVLAEIVEDEGELPEAPA